MLITVEIPLKKRLLVGSMALLVATAPFFATAQTTTESTPPRLQEGRNLFGKGDFESGLAGLWLSRPTLSQLDSNVVYRGEYSFRLRAQGEPKSDNPKQQDLILNSGVLINSHSPNTNYIFRCAVKIEGADHAHPVQFGFPVDTQDGEKKRTYLKVDREKTTLRQDTDWKVIEIELTGLPQEGAFTLGFLIKVPMQSNTTLWIDDIELHEVLP